MPLSFEDVPQAAQELFEVLSSFDKTSKVSWKRLKKQMLDTVVRLLRQMEPSKKQTKT